MAFAGWFLVAGLAPATADAQGRTFYGVATQGALGGDDYERMGRGGVGTLRFMVSWRQVEPSPGSYSWASTDQVIGQAAARGVSVLPAVHGLTPDGVRNPPTRASDRRAFRGFMRALAARYGPGGAYWQGPFGTSFPGAKARPVRTWQIHNEQNGPVHWGERPSPPAYGQLVKAGAGGVRSVDRGAEMVLGGMFATPSGGGSLTSWNFLKRLYRVKGIKRAFDSVALHPYSPDLRGIRYQMQRVRSVMRRHNHRAARIRVTELGWGSARRGHLNEGPKGQARMLSRSFRVLTRHRNRPKGWNVGGIIWFSWQDGTSACSVCASAGLFSGPLDDRQPKRSWRAFKRLTR